MSSLSQNKLIANFRCTMSYTAACRMWRGASASGNRKGDWESCGRGLLLAPFWLGSLLLTYFVTAHLPSCVIRLADGCAGCGEGRLFLLAWLCSSFLFFLFLQHSPYLLLAFENFFKERLMKNMNGVFIWCMEKHVLHNSQCKSQQFYLWVYVCLDHGCMTRISTRVTTI